MGYFQFELKLRTGEDLKFIRLLTDFKDIDQVHRIYNQKARDHYKKRLTSFKVVQLSKLDPEVKAWITSQGNPDSTLMNDLLNDFGQTTATANRKKKPGSEGPTLENRKG
jgi:hypothetical protein